MARPSKSLTKLYFCRVYTVPNEESGRGFYGTVPQLVKQLRETIPAFVHSQSVRREIIRCGVYARGFLDAQGLTTVVVIQPNIF